MIGAGLKQIAADNGLTVESGVAYGLLKGCYVSLSEGAGYKRMCIYVGCHHAPAQEKASKQGEVPEHMQAANAIADYIIEYAGDFEKYRIMTRKHKLPGVLMTQGGSVVQVNFFDNPGTMDCIRAFIDEILPEIAPATEPKVCAKCGLPNDGLSKPVLLTDEAVVPMHDACAQSVAAAFGKKSRPGGNFLGIFGALIGAAIGAVVWAAVGVMGYIASIVGILIAFLAGKGYELLGGRPGAFKVIVMILCVMLAVVAGSIGTEVYWLHDLYQEEVAGVPASMIAMTEMEFIVDTIPLLWEDAEVFAEFSKDILMGWGFAALGCFGLLRKSSGKGEPKVKVLNG